MLKSKNSRTASFWILGLLLNCLVTSTLAQSIPPQKKLHYEVKVTLKLIQVYVTDKKGNPIIDLKKENFTIYDNGEKKTVTEFEKHVVSLKDKKPFSKMQRTEEQPISSIEEKMPRKIFFFFDFLFTSPRGLMKAKQAALYFIETYLEPTDKIGVLSYSPIKGLVLHEYLTAEHWKVKDIIQKLGIKQLLGRAEVLEAKYWSLLRGENPKDASSSGYIFDPTGEKAPQLKLLAHQREVFTFHIYNFIQKMIDLAQAFRYIPGHKTILLFSGGVPYSLVMGKYLRTIDPRLSQYEYEPYEVFRHHISTKYEEMAKELSTANCSIYALDTSDASFSVGDFQTKGVFSLQKLTKTTGGKYFGNINNYKQHVEKIQKITGSYYVLGYYVSEEWDGKYHKIKVEVDRPGCRVYAQKGYFNPKPFKKYGRLEKMLHLVDLALNEKSLYQIPMHFPLRAFAYPEQGRLNLALWVKIPKEKIDFIGGKKTEVVAIIFDQKGNIIEMQRKEIDLTAFVENNFYFIAYFSLSFGNYKYRVVIRDLESGRGAVASLSVPIFKTNPKEIKLFSPLLMTKKRNGSVIYLSSLPVDFFIDSSNYFPIIEKVERDTECIFASLACSCRDIQDPEIKIMATLIKSRPVKPITLSVPMTIIKIDKKNERQIFFIEISLAGLEPGKYLLYFFAKEMRTGLKSQVNTSFSID